MTNNTLIEQKLKKKRNAKSSQKSTASFTNKIICGDAVKVLKEIPDESVDCVVTSPPYYLLRNYGVDGQIGLEPSLEEYLRKTLAVFDEIRRVLKPAGTCWVNFGDTYAHAAKGGQRNKPRRDIFDSLAERSVIPKLKPESGVPAKSLCLIPARFALRMIDCGWILRNEIIWHKPNVMPQSARDRFTVDFEKLFFFVKQRNYYFKQQFEPPRFPPRSSDFVRSGKSKYSPKDRYVLSMNSESAASGYRTVVEKGRNKRCVWTISTSQFSGDHFAVYPPRLVETPILAGCPEGGIVLDPFMGSGTTAIVAQKLKRRFIGIELNPSYVKLARQQLSQSQ